MDRMIRTIKHWLGLCTQPKDYDNFIRCIKAGSKLGALFFASADVWHWFENHLKGVIRDDDGAEVRCTE